MGVRTFRHGGSGGGGGALDARGGPARSGGGGTAGARLRDAPAHGRGTGLGPGRVRRADAPYRGGVRTARRRHRPDQDGAGGLSAMGSVQVTVNGRNYSVACDEGQEAHVARLGSYLEQKVGQLVKSVGQVGDARLLVMASMMITDELVDTDQALTQLKSAVANGSQGRAPLPTPAAAAQPPAPRPAPHESVLAEALETLADRIEAIAAELEQDYL